MSTPARAPSGDLSSYERVSFTQGAGIADVYRKGDGPAVVITAELPGITPMVLGFADRIVDLGCTAVVPDLFGEPGRDPESGARVADTAYAVRTFAGACVSRRFTALATGRSSPVVESLRALAAAEHERCGGPGVGVVGMCFTGGFALAMAVDDRVLAPVLSQPSLPLPVTRSRRGAIDCSPAALDRVADRCAHEGLTVLGLRFRDDPFVPAERFSMLRDRLGDAFVAVEIDQADGHPDSPQPRHHSVLTGDLVDEPGQPTREGLDRVLDLLRTRLLPSAGPTE